MRQFIKDENGSISVGISILFPIIVMFMAYTQQTWQAHYIRMETQAILDFATLGAAETGEATRTSQGVLCAIPFDAGNTTYSGAHVASYLIEENKHVLPTQLQKQLSDSLVNFKMDGLSDWELQGTGYIHLRTNLRYRVPFNLFYQNYVFNIESTARCQPDATTP